MLQVWQDLTADPKGEDSMSEKQFNGEFLFLLGVIMIVLGGIFAIGSLNAVRGQTGFILYMIFSAIAGVGLILTVFGSCEMQEYPRYL